MVSEDRLRVLLVEDHPVVCLGVKTVINAQPDMLVVGEADTVNGALLAAERLMPDLVILALRLEGAFGGVELCRNIRSLPEAPTVLVYTSFNSAEDVSSSYLAGADGFVFKGTGMGRLLSSIRNLRRGRPVWITGRAAKDQSADLARAVAESGLTPREQEVLGFMLQHFSNKRIAEELVIELSTVKTHVRSILQKLNLENRRALF